MVKGRNKMRQILLMSMVFVLVGALPIEAQLPGEQIVRRLKLKEVLRTLESDPVGIEGLISVTPRLLQEYPDLNAVYGEQIDKINRANRKLELFRRDQPNTSAQWSVYLRAFRDIAAAQESMMEALRGKFHSRDPVLRQILEDRIGNSRATNFATWEKYSRMFKALDEIQVQLDQQKRDVVKRNMKPIIDYPDEIPPDLREAIELTIRSSAARSPKGRRIYGEVVAFIERYQKLLQSVSKQVKNQIDLTDGQLLGYEEAVIAEMNLVAAAIKDAAVISMMHQGTLDQLEVTNTSYKIWQEVN